MDVRGRCRVASVIVLDFERFGADTTKMAECALFLIEERGLRDVVVDLEGSDHVSGRMMGALLLIHQRLREQDGTLRLVNVSPFVYEVLKLTRLTEVFEPL